MYNDFKKHISSHFNISKRDKILLAVSGGADSVVMLDLFAREQYNCGIAHCNFHLRGEDSNQDEQFVNRLADKYNFEWHSIEFNTKEYAAKHGISIEMAARNLRYSWFENIRQSFDYKYIAVAHHKDDIIETFFINLIRGTGIRGLSGIKWQNGNIIRPLLFACREDIINYTKSNKLNYREDKTNKDTAIIRNKLRHDILPLLKEINPAADNNILKTINNLYSSELIVNQKINEFTNQAQNTVNQNISIDISKIKTLDPNQVLLYELLRKYQFNSSQVQDIYNALNGESGRVFVSKTHRLVKNRNQLIISKLKDSEFSISISENCRSIKLPNSQILSIATQKIPDNYKIPTQDHTVALDLDTINFPLKIRNWRNGDYFYPLGMKQRKKLSDFFVDQKYSILDKQNALLLLSGNKIVWIIGKRIDNRFKITEKTKNILELKIERLQS